MTEIDNDILLLAQKGNRKAFQCLYKHYSPFIWRLCFRASNGDKGAAEEIMQNVFVKVHRSLPGFSRRSALSTWLYSVTYSMINEHFRKKTRDAEGTVQFDEAFHNSGGTKDTYADQQLVHRILESLSQQDRFLLTAREVDGFSYEELAAITGQAEGTLRTRLSRLKSDVRKRTEQLTEGSRQ